jgi:hypothetical protein
VGHEKIYFILCDFIMLSVNAQRLDDKSNICRRLQCVEHQVLKHWAMGSTGVWNFGSVMEVLHVGADRGLEQAVGCDHTAEGLGMGKEVLQHL